MRNSAAPQGPQLCGEIVFHATDFDLCAVDQEIARTVIAVVRESDAP
jgi:hypothetical protein